MIQVVILALVTAVFWGTAPILEKAALRTATPLAGLAIRSFAIAAVMAVIIFVAGMRTEVLGVGKREIALFAGGGLLAGFAGQLTHFYALKIGQASIVVPIIAGLYPVVAATWGIWFLKEPLTAAKVLGAALIVAGVVVIRSR